MADKYLYLIIDLSAVAIPFAASFHPKTPFYRHWKNFGIALFIAAAFFILWDELFTRIGVWGVNERYITGIYISALPLEAVLFFICIPYACVFTYFALNQLVEKDYLFPHQELITSVLITVLLIAGMYNKDKAYTCAAFVLPAVFLAYQMLKLRPRYMGRFYFAFVVLLIPFLIVNALLTGSFIEEEVVWYNNDYNLGIRLGTIPLEDFFYAMLLIVMPITIWEWLEDYFYYKKK